MNTTDEGFLLNAEEWSPEFVTVTAEAIELSITDSHWEIINTVRDFYLESNIAPTYRVLVGICDKKLGKEKGNSLYLNKLFLNKAHRNICRLAGLPKPPHCI